MTARDLAALLLLPVAAIAAAATFRPAVAPAEWHDPQHQARFREDAALQPFLASLRVRSADPRACRRLEAVPGLGDVVDPERAARALGHAALLYAPEGRLREILEDPVGVEPPEPPDVRLLFRDGRGVVTCEAAPVAPGALKAVRARLPEAELSGEPVYRTREAAWRPSLARAAIAAVVVAALACGRTAPSLDAGLLSALLPLAALGVSGLGVDAPAVLAAAIAGAAPSGLPLLAGAAAFAAPSLALERAGLVLALGGLVKLAFRPTAPARPSKPRLLAAALGPALALALALAPSPRPRLAFDPALEPAAAFALESRGVADALRASLPVAVVGDEPLEPPEPSPDRRHRIRRIFQLARDLGDARLMDAASVDRLIPPRDVTLKTRTSDGRAVLWVLAHGDAAPLAGDERLTGPALYRWRGDVQLRREGWLYGMAVFALGALLAPRSTWRTAMAYAAGVLVLRLGEMALPLAAATPPGEALHVLLAAVAAVAPARTLALPLLAAAAASPAMFTLPAAALAVTVLVGARGPKKQESTPAPVP